MKVTPLDEKITNMTISTVYPCYVKKVEKKGRTIAELDQVIKWLTGLESNKVKELIEKEVSLKDFFAEATLNEKATLIKGVICGYRVEEIENPLTQQVRYLDKLVDELAKGKTMEKVLRDE